MESQLKKGGFNAWDFSQCKIWEESINITSLQWRKRQFQASDDRKQPDLRSMAHPSYGVVAAVPKEGKWTSHGKNILIASPNNIHASMVLSLHDLRKIGLILSLYNAAWLATEWQMV